MLDFTADFQPFVVTMLPDRAVAFLLILLMLVTLGGLYDVTQRGESAQQAEQPFSEGVFWRVTKDGQVVGHILGTLHSNDERVTRIPAKVQEIFKQSKGYAIEAFPGSELWNPYHGFQSIRGRMMLPKGQTLAELTGEEVAQEVYAILKRNNAEEEFARRIKPWAAIHSLTIKSEHSGPIVDQKLLDLAVLQGKELYQVESPEELLAAFYAMPMDSQVSLLKDKLRAYPDLRNTMESIVQAYQREDLHGMMKLSTAFIDKDPDKHQHHVAYLKHAIEDRSVVMAHYMSGPFEIGNAFIAVGALHLYGKKSVLALLSDPLFGGYQVERVVIN